MDAIEQRRYTKFISDCFNGGSGVGAMVSCTLNQTNGGSVRSVSINNPGSGYQVNDTLSLDGFESTDVQFSVTNVDETGAVLEIAIDNPGSGFGLPSRKTNLATSNVTATGTNLSLDVIVHYVIASVLIDNPGMGYNGIPGGIGYPTLTFLPENENDIIPDIDSLSVDSNGSVTELSLSGGRFTDTPEIRVTGKVVSNLNEFAQLLIGFDTDRIIPRLESVINNTSQVGILPEWSVDFIKQSLDIGILEGG